MYLGVIGILQEKQPYTSNILGTEVIWDLKHVFHMKITVFLDLVLQKWLEYELLMYKKKACVCAEAGNAIYIKYCIVPYKMNN